MQFSINGTKWNIIEKDEKEMNSEMQLEGTMGITNYTKQQIWLLKDQPNIFRTLRHELSHVWLYEYGHNQQNPDKTFDYEDVCEIIACSSNFINKTVEEFKKFKNKEQAE